MGQKTRYEPERSLRVAAQSEDKGPSPALLMAAGFLFTPARCDASEAIATSFLDENRSQAWQHPCGRHGLCLRRPIPKVLDSSLCVVRLNRRRFWLSFGGGDLTTFRSNPSLRNQLFDPLLVDPAHFLALPAAERWRAFLLERFAPV